jgi:hypothetical protein
LLLKKELDFLARDSGHSVGLNSVPTQKSQPSSLDSSETDLRQIVSRVSLSALSDDTPKAAPDMVNEDASVEVCKEDSNEKEENNSPNDGRSDSSIYKENEERSKSVFDVEEYSRLEFSEEDTFKVTQSVPCKGHVPDRPHLELQELFSSVLPENPRNLQSEEKLNYFQRSKSPIFYYKNPEFGKRFACKMEGSTYEQGDTRQQEKNLTDKTSQSYRDSTQFLFPPVLSDSRLSTCDITTELGDKEEEHGIDKEFRENFLKVDIVKSDQKQDSHLDEIREYNLHLQQKICKTSRENEHPLALHSKPAVTFAEEETCMTELLVRKLEVSSVATENCLETESVSVNSWPEAIDQVNKYATDKAELDQETVEEMDLHGAAEALESVSESSWLRILNGLSADIQNTDSPLPVIIFLSLVVLIFGIMGRFFINLSEWFELHYLLKDEEHMDAVLDH